MSKLSLCIAVHNEANTIHYAIDSVIDIVDEIVIVDGCSDDGTKEKALSYGEKIHFIDEINRPMFHINKQKALENAVGEWIIQLDADEALSDELKNEIKEIISSWKVGSPVAYWIPRKNLFLTRFLEKGGQYPDYTIRLYRRGFAYFPCESVHEQVAVNGEIGFLQKPIMHYADPDFSRYLMRWNRYTSVDAEILAKKSNLGFYTFFLYFFWKPFCWFFLTYFRHKGFYDGFPGFVFSLFSALRFLVIYVKAWSLKRSSFTHCF